MFLQPRRAEEAQPEDVVALGQTAGQLLGCGPDVVEGDDDRMGANDRVAGGQQLARFAGEGVARGEGL